MDCFGYEKKHGIAKYILEKQTTTIRSCELVKINDCFKLDVSLLEQCHRFLVNYSMAGSNYAKPIRSFIPRNV